MALVTTLGLVMLAQTAGETAVQTPVQSMDRVEVAYEELASGQNSAAIARIERSDAAGGEDPARLINLAIAHAREGDVATARALFMDAARLETRYRLETANGEWMDSRELARRGLAMLERGEIGQGTRMASR